MAHTGKGLLKVIVGRLSDCCKLDNILPDEQCGFRPRRSTADIIFVVRQQQELTRKKDAPLCLCFVDFTKAFFDSVDRTLLLDVLARCGVSPRMLAAVRQFHYGMQGCARSDDGQCSDEFYVGQGLRQGCVLAPLLCSVFVTTVLCVAEKTFGFDADITGIMVQLQRQKENVENKGTSRVGKMDGRGSWIEETTTLEVVQQVS